MYPGTNVLQNLKGLREREALEQFEADATWRRTFQLIMSPISGRFDTAHLQAIHRHLFQDVYAWAGQFRTVNISKPGETWFARTEFIEPALDGLMGHLAGEQYLRGLPVEPFAERCGYYLSELNAIHPFREGNGRTQREFMRQLALLAGYRLLWSRITAEQMTDASRRSFNQGEHSALATLIRAGLEPLRGDVPTRHIGPDRE